MTDTHTDRYKWRNQEKNPQKGNPGKFFSGYLKFREPTFNRWLQ